MKTIKNKFKDIKNGADLWNRVDSINRSNVKKEQNKLFAKFLVLEKKILNNEGNK